MLDENVDRWDRLFARNVRSALVMLIPDSGYVTGENVNVDGGLRHIAMEHMMPAGGTYKPD